MNLDLKLLADCYARLQDEESRKLFDLRFNYALDRSMPNFINGIRELNKSWKLELCDDFSKLYKGQKLVIFGGGAEGFLTEQVLNSVGYEVYAYCDNNPEKQGSFAPTGKKIYSPYDLQATGEEFFYIVASRFHGHEMYRQLRAELIAPYTNMFLPCHGAISAYCDDQYFDCEQMMLEDGEIFVDMGMLNGETSKRVANDVKYTKIIGFEPSRIAIGDCRNTLNGLENIEIYPYAAWDKREELSFFFEGGGSRVADYGSEKVIGESLDTILAGEKVTFIKMDVEGAEEKALIGAKQTIRKYKPKLAVSLYHKPEDIFVLPSLILSIRDDYKFVIRHYASRIEETVLYAF